jgi:hypothetical protein
VKKKLNKKSRFDSSIVKAIPLSVAITLFASTNALAAAGTIAVNVPGRGVVTFDANLLNTNDSYRRKAQEFLSRAWRAAEPIYYSPDGAHFDDFSKNARPGLTLDQVLAVSKGGAGGGVNDLDGNRRVDYFDISAIEELPLLDLNDSLY